MALDERRSRRNLYTFAVLFALAFAVRLYPASSVVTLTPDAVEYLDQARHNARGEIGTISIKRHYLDDYPAVYSGTSYRPPAFPLVAGAVLAMGGSVSAVQTVNALIASLAVGIWYLAFASLFPWRAAVAAALASSFSLWFWGTSVISLTEPLSLLLGGCIVWVVATGLWETLWGAGCIGALCALAYMTRHMNIMYIPLVAGLWVLGTWRLRGGRARLKAAARLLVALVAGAILIVPLALRNVRDFGSPFYDPNSMILRGGQKTFDHFTKPPIGTFLQFVEQTGVTTLAGRIAKGFWANLKAVTLGPGGLGLMTLALPLVVLLLFRRKQPPGVWFLVGLALLNYAAYSPLYSFDYGDPRFILLTTFSLSPLCLFAVDRWPWLQKSSLALTGRAHGLANGFIVLCVALAIVQGVLAFRLMLLNYPVQTVHGVPTRIIPREILRYAPADYDALFREIEQHTKPHALVATRMAWLVNFYTRRPTALLPPDLDETTYPVFLEQYGVQWVVLDPEFLGRKNFQRNAALVRSLAAQGRGRVTDLGPYVIFQVGDGAVIPASHRETTGPPHTPP